MAGERRVTEGTRSFLFADLRDYTGFVERRGDQAAAALVAAYRKLIRERVRESAGAEVKVEGDAIFVAFPSARQAIACGAAILKDASAHTSANADLPLRIGIGIHAGEPVPQDGDYIGAAVNVAARIGAVAGAGQLLISDVVRSLVRTSLPFPLQDRGPVMLKGLSEPIHLYEVAWGGEPRTDSHALMEGTLLPAPQPPRSATSVSPLLGREPEVELLRARLAALREGAGSTVLIGGDAGIGKSRLLREALTGSLPTRTILYGACGLSEAPPPYEPFVAMIRSIVREPDGEAALQRVAPELLALVPEAVASGQQRPDRDRLFGAFLRVLRQYGRARPTVLVIEDLHWADEATLAILQVVIADAEPTPYLVFGTYRSDELHRRHRLRPFLAALGRRPDVVTLALTSLTADSALRLLRAIPTLTDATAAELAAISQRAEGNPLFLEELAQTHQPGQAGVVPASVADTVLARVARAGTNAARLLGYVAVTGVRANYDILEPLMGDEAALLEGARSAVEQHLLVEEGDGLAFRHALTREAVLSDLMARERRAVHRAVGEAMERLYGTAPDQAGEIAEHLAAAGLHERALPFAMRAGERALRLHAPEEAARAYEHAVEWSTSGSRDRMAALEGLGRAYAQLLRVRKAVATYREALELARSVGAQDDVARISLLVTFAMPWGRQEYAAWQAAWDAAEPLGKPAALARIATGLARRAHLYFEDDRATAWLDRAISEARRAGARDIEVRALRQQGQYRHHPGWQEADERYAREQLERAVAQDDGVLEAYRDVLVRGSRNSDAAQREQVIQAGRAYAERLAIPQGMVFRYGVVWVNWLTGNWAQAQAMWSEVRARWSEDAPDIYPDAGPIAAAIEVEVGGPDAGSRSLSKATESMRKSETWRGLLAAAAHESNLWLAEDRPDKVLATVMPILKKRPPAMLDVESFALTSRVVLPALLLTDDRKALALWTEDPAVAAGGALYQGSVDHARAIAALLDGDTQAADGAFASAATNYLQHGWLLLAHELAWQRAKTGTAQAHAAMEVALTFYEQRQAGWRRRWLAEGGGTNVIA
ncbi:MAG TPA: AAA family ATPase [Candidatus Dormibacteraeota bacterium]|nr:AAA family ATPase [Candidatus Dormibacteraeota bacterium]